jgi:2-polyprenyl-6-methoxyphenol hydroxylase-like FAD-dependent oxidoreductase
MGKNLRIAIVGYGAAGQAAALFLSAQGHELSVFEQAASPGPVGAGFLLQPTGLSVLDRLGLLGDALEKGQRIERLYGCNANGRRVMDMRYVDHAAGFYGLGMTRGSLFTLMHEAWLGTSPRQHERLHTGVCMTGVDADGRHLIDSLGRRLGPYDLIVIADGAHSRLRQTSPDIVRRHALYEWGAVWCLLPAKNWPDADTLHQRYSGSREMIGLLPVGQRADVEGRWLTFFFSLPGDQVDAFDRAALIRMRERIRQLWPEALPLVEPIEDPATLHRARYRDVVLRTPISGRCIFIGDAAHAMSPQLGQGVNMALLDAQALADALSATADVAVALCNYARMRRRHLAVYQQLSRWLTPLFQSDRSDLARWRDACFGPLGRFPVARGQMLKILTGTKKAWWH